MEFLTKTPKEPEDPWANLGLGFAERLENSLLAPLEFRLINLIDEVRRVSSTHRHIEYVIHEAFVGPGLSKALARKLILFPYLLEDFVCNTAERPVEAFLNTSVAGIRLARVALNYFK